MSVRELGLVFVGGDVVLLPIPAVSFSSWVLGHTQCACVCVWGVRSAGGQSGSAAGTGSFLFTKVGSLLPIMGPCCLFCFHTRGPSW